MLSCCCLHVSLYALEYKRAAVSPAAVVSSCRLAACCQWPRKIAHPVTALRWPCSGHSSLSPRCLNVSPCPSPLPAPPDEEEEEEDEEDEEVEEEESRYFRTVSKRRIRMTPFVSLKTFRQHCSEKETTQAQVSCVSV